MMCAARTSGSGCATPILQDQAPHVPPGTSGEDPGNACFPFTHAHGSQEMHTKQIPVTSSPDLGFLKGEKGPASSLPSRRQGGSHSPHPGTGRPCLSLSTSSKPQVYCGAVAFSTHPALRLSTQAGSLSGSPGLGESHGLAHCLQGSNPFLLLGLRVGASPLSFPLHNQAPCDLRRISLLGGPR